METSDTPTFMMVGRTIIGLLYNDPTLNEATGIAGRYVKAFKGKLAACVDSDALVMEWGVAAFLDPR